MLPNKVQGLTHNDLPWPNCAPSGQLMSCCYGLKAYELQYWSIYNLVTVVIAKYGN